MAAATLAHHSSHMRHACKANYMLSQDARREMLHTSHRFSCKRASSPDSQACAALPTAHARTPERRGLSPVVLRRLRRPAVSCIANQSGGIVAVAAAAANPIAWLVKRRWAMCVVAAGAATEVVIAALLAKQIARFTFLQQWSGELAIRTCTIHPGTQVH